MCRCMYYMHKQKTYDSTQKTGMFALLSFLFVQGWTYGRWNGERRRWFQHTGSVQKVEGKRERLGSQARGEWNRKPWSRWRAGGDRTCVSARMAAFDPELNMEWVNPRVGCDKPTGKNGSDLLCQNGRKERGISECRNPDCFVATGHPLMRI